MSSVLSVNVGTPSPLAGRTRRTGIGKMPVDHIEVVDPGPKQRGAGREGLPGVNGDFIGNGRHHGGSGQAVYAFAREELDHWERELGREIPPGLFGENLTTIGVDVDGSEQGDVWQAGSAVLQVTGPRVPCATFAARMGERAWMRRFAERGHSGCYLAVVEPGRITPGDEVVVGRSASGLALPRLLAAWMGDRDEMRAALTHAELDTESRARFTRALTRPSRPSR